MRITPLDIRKQEFHRVMRGLDAEEVYAFLSTVGDEYEALLNDNKALRDRILELDDKVQEYRTMEKTLRDTLITAERVAVEAKDNARREASLMVKEAQIEVEKSLRDIKGEAVRLRQEVQQLRSQRDGYLARMKVVAESHMKFLETAEAGFDEDDEAVIKQLSEDESKTSARRPDQNVSNANLFTPKPDTSQKKADVSTDTSKTEPDDVHVAALADMPMESTSDTGPQERADQGKDAVEPAPVPSQSPGETAKPAQPGPEGTSTLSDINEILERMAEGQKQTLSSTTPTPPDGVLVERAQINAVRPEKAPKLPATETVPGGESGPVSNVPSSRPGEPIVTRVPSGTPKSTPPNIDPPPKRTIAEGKPEESKDPAPR